jgi:hypothetical protein
MRRTRLIQLLSLSIFASFAFATRSAAQSPVDPDALPGRTLFYILWHGTPTGEIRKNNSLYALWDDPEFASARTSFVESFLNEAQKQKDKPAVSREQLAEYITLLDNPFLIGYLPHPESPAAAKSSSAKTAPPPAWNGMFFIYDRSGKEELLSKAVLQTRTADKEIPKLTNLTVGGVAALKIERKGSTTYWSEFGKYAVAASEQSVFEDIVNLLNGKRAATALSQSATFQEAKPLLTGGVVEFFLAIPRADSIPLDSSSPSAAQVKMLLGALKLDSVHSVAGHISLEGAKTHVTGGILGDASPGSLFDIWADGQAKPASLGYVSPDTVYYGESEFNLLGIYNILKRAFTPPGGSSAKDANPLEAMAETRLGMPLPEALGLTTGEVAWIQNSPTLDDSQKVYMLGIRNKPNALKLARTLMGERITSERNEGDTTYLKVSLQGGQGAAGVAQWNFYYVAMAPTLLFGAGKSDTLHKYVGQAPASTDAAFPKTMLAARLQYPEKLNGFSFFDFQKVDWPGLKTTWTTDVKKFAQGAKTPEGAENNKKFTDWLSQVNPEVFPRHLHSMSGASWKDATGVHFDEWLD